MSPSLPLPEWARLIAAKRAQHPDARETFTHGFAHAVARLADAAEVALPALAWSHDAAVSR